MLNTDDNAVRSSDSAGSRLDTRGIAIAASRNVEGNYMDHRQAAEITDGALGLPEDVSSAMLRHRIIACAPLYGWSRGVVDLMEYLISRVPRGNWGAGGLLACWPSNEDIGRELGAGPTTVQTWIREARAARLVTIRSSANGKRYPRYLGSGAGKILVDVCGFDLGITAARYDEFDAKLEQKKSDSRECAELKTRIGRLRREIKRACADAVLNGGGDPARWDEWCSRAKAKRRRGMGLEQLRALDMQLTGLFETVDKAWQELRFHPESEPLDTKNGAHRELTTPVLSPRETYGRACESVVAPRLVADMDERSAAWLDRTEVIPLSLVLEAVPEVHDFLPCNVASAEYEDLEAAGRRIGRELNVSEHLLTRARLAMGSRRFAVAMAVVLARKLRGAVLTTPGCYLHGMVENADKGELYLLRSIYGLRHTGRLTSGGREVPGGRGTY